MTKAALAIICYVFVTYYFVTYCYIIDAHYFCKKLHACVSYCRMAPKLLLSPQWPNGLASQETQVENLGLLATPVGQALRALALT